MSIENAAGARRLLGGDFPEVWEEMERPDAAGTSTSGRATSRLSR